MARYDVRQDRYEPGVERIETLSDPGALRGSAATVRARGSAPLAVPEGLTRDDAEEILRARFTDDLGDPVRPDLTLSGGIVVARDYESFSLVTLYHHLEQAQRFLSDAGADISEIDRLDVLYRPDLTVGDALVVDNFFYVFGARVLAALSLDRLGDVPLAQNEGVIAHEVMHALWDARVLDEEATFRRLDPDTDWRAVNLLDATSEGVADFVGAATAGDPDFMRHSVPPDRVGDCGGCVMPFSRDVAGPAVLDPAWIEGADLSPSAYLQTAYRVGTALASALWRTSDDRAAVARALVDATADLGARLLDEPPWESAPPSFGPAWLLDPLAARLEPPERDALCEIVRSDLAPIAAHVASCAL